MADEIKLTLDMPTPAAPELDMAAAVAEETQQLAQQVQAEAEKKTQFTPEEQKTIDEFSQKIDILDSNLVFAYGASAQQNISQFSDTALKNIQTKDLDEVGNMIAGLVGEIKGFSVDEEKGSFLEKFFGKKKDQLEILKARYTDAETNINKICEGLEQHQITMLKDIALLDQLYEQNLHYFKELSMYIAAGKQRLESFRANELQEALDKATASNLPEDAQAAKDLSDKADRFEKKIYDLELTRNISIQMAPQIRLIQSSNQMMAEKIQTSLVNTIPLWKSQMVLALGMAHTESAMKAQRAVTDVTNDLLTKNAEKLHMASVESAKESERGIVDIETLTHTNQMLLDTMDEVINIQKEGREKRKSAEVELSNIENQLKAKLRDVNFGK